MTQCRGIYTKLMIYDFTIFMEIVDAETVVQNRRMNKRASSAQYNTYNLLTCVCFLSETHTAVCALRAIRSSWLRSRSMNLQPKSRSLAFSFCVTIVDLCGILCRTMWTGGASEIESRRSCLIPKWLEGFWRKSPADAKAFRIG